MNEITKQPSHSQEMANIGEEASRDAGFQQMIKFKKGRYISDNTDIPLGTQFIAHCIGWTKMWVHFEDRKVVERKIYRPALKQQAPERDELPNNDQSRWPNGLDGKPADPWVLQYLLPLESRDGDVRIFVGGSVGGRRAVAGLCSTAARRNKTHPGSGMPLIRIQTGQMPTKNFGDVACPIFEVIGWDGEVKQPVREVSQETLKRADYDDEIPF